MGKKAKTNVIASKAKQSGKKMILVIALLICTITVIILSHLTTNAADNITLTINKEQTLTLEKNTCTPFSLDTITTTNNTLGYNLKVYLRTNTAGNNITITQNTNTIPTDSNNSLTIIDTAGTTANELKTTEYEVCADNNMTNGDYHITIAYILQNNIPTYAKVINGAYFQDKTTNLNETCSAMPVYDATNPDPNSTIVMIDNRNDQEYLVRKLKDEKCWMIDNLKLELENGMVLMPTTTNVTTDIIVDFNWSNFTTNHDDKFVTSGYLTKTGTYNTVVDSYAWRQVDPSNTANCLNNTGASGNGNISYDSSSKTKCGYLYNSYAATASTVDGTETAGIADGSICPAGWKLPSGQNADGDFGTLDKAYPSGTGSSHDLASPDTQALWLSAGAWQGAFGGYYSSGFGGQGSFGIYWSSSVVPGNYTIDMDFNSSRVDPGTIINNSRDYGLAVRCLVE
ncbi:MAG: fibrobacter succinogenes major paralogous domain-containing protein [Candidatus Nomurabacteria bacterium]|jgi:uncharacterized protein (TIGR02145 family)|nr:fibrobacter succinogenes major paralogous domain-containing protein [Candidatus Nomurabacteria bacterium]